MTLTLTAADLPGTTTESGAMSPHGDRPRRRSFTAQYKLDVLAEHEAVVPGYHMDKRHWITVTLGVQPPAELVEELVLESPELVVAGLPERLRPAGT